jgi:hypothetical protein
MLLVHAFDSTMDSKGLMYKMQAYTCNLEANAALIKLFK